MDRSQPSHPHTLAEAVKQHRAGPDFWVALNEFLDEFYAADDERQSMIEQEPAFIGDPRLDAYIGAVGEHLARRWGLDHIPQWTLAKERFLDRPWFPGAETPKHHSFQLVYSPDRIPAAGHFHGGRATPTPWNAAR